MMAPVKGKRSRPLKGKEGLVATYGPYFEGEGRVIVVQGIVAFVGGLCEALMLVVIAKLAFSIGSESGGSASELGFLQGLKLSVGNLFLVAAGLAVLRALVQAVGAHLTAGLVARRMVALRAGIYSDYSVASWSKQATLDESAVTDLLGRHVNRVISAMVTLATSFSLTFTIIALLASALLVDPLSAAFVVVCGAALFLALRPLSRVAKRYSELQVRAGRRYVQDSLSAIGLSLEIRSFGVGDEVASRLAHATEQEVRPIYVGQFLQRLVGAAYQFAAIAMVLVGLYGVFALLDRPVASLGAIVIILVRAMSQASSVQSAYHSAVDSAPFARSLAADRAALRASAPSSGSVRPPHRSALTFDDVSYSYAESPVRALDQVSFEIHPGEAVGVIGPSGSGKSTLIQLLMRLREPTLGSFEIGGVDTRSIDEHAWFSQIAFVPQDCRSLNGTIMENIRFYRPHLGDSDVVDAAKRAHLHKEILAMPDGYQTELGSRGGSLSGGQRQRMAIARALADRPEILVLDEPTSALDMRSESLVHQTLTDLQGSVTLVLIAHRMSTLKTCDRIMVFGNGRLEAFGERSELEASSAFYRDAIALSELRS